MHECIFLRLSVVVLLLAACTRHAGPLPMGGGGGSSGGSGGGSGGNQAGGSRGAGGDATDGGGQAIDADAYAALQIVQVQVLGGGDCTVPAAPTSTHRASGTLDLALPDGSAPAYTLPVAVANYLDPSGSSPGSEMNSVTLTNFTVELSAPDVVWSSTCPATFDTATLTYFLAPRTTAGLSFDVLTPAHSRCLQPYVAAKHLVVTATIRAKGRHGGTSIASAPFVFSIEVCSGCLQTGYSDPALMAYQYPAVIPLCSALTGVNPYPGDPCASPGQDAKILCCGGTTTAGGTVRIVGVCPGMFTGTPSIDAAASSDH
jgi:hypothetical protein